MQYSEIRNTIKTGDAFFTSSETITSDFIRFFTRSRVSHCGLFFWSGKRLMIFEMLPDGESISFASEWTKKTCESNTVYWGRIRHKRTANQIIDSIEMDFSESGYDFIGAMASPISTLNVPSRYFCSEAVSIIL